MPKFTLVCDHSCDLDTHVVTHQFNVENIYDVIEQFEFFLKGAGFYPPGRLEFVNDEMCAPCGDSDCPCNHSEHYFDTGRNR